MADGWIFSEMGWTGARNRTRRLGLFAGIAALAGLATATLLLVIHWYLLWSPLEKHYLAAYRQSATPAFPILGSARGNYPLLVVSGPSTAEYLATDRDVVETGAGQFTLSPAARSAGLTNLQNRMFRATDAEIYWTLRQSIYSDRSLASLWRVPRYAGLLVFLGLIGFLIVRDGKETEEARRWKTDPNQPVEVSPQGFNELHAGQGIGFLVNVPGETKPVAVRIPSNYEVQHFALLGDTGSGKTVGMMQLLDQVRKRNEAAIVYDPFGEFAARYYDPEKGDLIIHPPDARSPAWAMEEEIQRMQDLDNLVEAIFPMPPPGVEPFWCESARAVLRQLLEFRPSPMELVDWITDEKKLDERLAGTLAAKRVIKESPGQRAGVLSYVAKAGGAFAWLRMEDPSVGTWSTQRWTEARRGFLFFTTNADTRTGLRPLISMWMDLLIQRLLAQVDPSPDRQKALSSVWLFIDEVYTLQQLPRLQDALTLSRKANLRVVLGFQGKSQLEELYGKTGAQTLLSQPQTKVILQTKEPGAAQWASATLGQSIRERTVESVTAGVQDPRDSINYNNERRTEPMILDSAIMGLPNRTGYLKFLNSVVKIELHLAPRAPIAPAWVPREDPVVPLQPESDSKPPVKQSIETSDAAPATGLRLWK